MRQIEKGIFIDLNQLEIIENDFSMRSIQKGKKALNKHLYSKMRNQCEGFDIFGMIELQKQPIYRTALRQVITAYDIEEQLINAAKGWDFAVINSSVFDTLFTDKHLKRKCAEKIVYLIATGNFVQAEKTLIESIKKARARVVEQSYNHIDVSAERIEVPIKHGLVAKDEATHTLHVYDKNSEMWMLPIEYYKKYNTIPDELIQLGVTEDILKSILEEESNG